MLGAVGGLRRTTRSLLVATAISLVTAVAPPLSHAQANAQTTAPAWLDKINQIRTESGLAAVTINDTWTAGIEAHLRYMALTPDSYYTGQYASIHTENPQSPYYTQAGADEAGKSNLIFHAANGAINSINTWLSVPFHAIGILRPQLKQVALAVDNTTGMAGLDVISGYDTQTPPATAPILFPGNGAVLDIPTFGGNEVPDPLETCGKDQYAHAGMPLVALLTAAPDPNLTASLTGPNGTAQAPGSDLCIVDENTFTTSDPVYGDTGKQILQGDRAVFLVPRTPLVAGHYSATISQPNQADITWSFDSAPQTAAPTLATQRLVCAWKGESDGRAIVNVVHDEDYASTGHYTVRLGGTTKTLSVPDRGTGKISFTGLGIGTYTIQATGTYDAVHTLRVTITKCTAVTAAWAKIGKPDWAERKVRVTLDNSHNHKGVNYDVLTGQGSTLTRSKSYDVPRRDTQKVTVHFTAGRHPIVMVSIGQHVVVVKQYSH